MTAAPTVQKDAYAEAELPLAIGVSRRAAHRIARELGRKVGARRIVLRAELVRWLRAQPREGAAR